MVCFASGKAQEMDTITFVTGNTFVTDEVIFEEDYIACKEVKKSGKVRWEYFEREYVFSIQGMHDTLFYRQDTANGFYYNQQEMMYFIWGAQDAKKHYRTRWVSTFGVLYGAAASYPIYESFYVFAIPFPYIAFGAFSGVALKEEYLSHPELRNEESYMHGYQQTAKGQKVLAAFFSSIAGAAIGISMGHITSN